jgi:hypothetical protein
LKLPLFHLKEWEEGLKPKTIETEMEKDYLPTMIPDIFQIKYCFQKVYEYQVGTLKGVDSRNDLQSLVFQDVFESCIPKLSFPSNKYQGEIARNVWLTLSQLVKNIQNCEDLFLKNIHLGLIDDPDAYVGEEVEGKIVDTEPDESYSLSEFYDLYEALESKICWKLTPNELFEKDFDEKKFFLNGRTVSLTIYVALPYSEEILSPTLHSRFLEDFQLRWNLERPWRFVKTKVWIYIPCSCPRDVQPEIFNYARHLRYKLWSKRDSYFKKLVYTYRYLRLATYFSNAYDLRQEIQQKMLERLGSKDEYLSDLEEFFEGSIGYIYCLIQDLKSLEYVKKIHPRLNQDFVMQVEKTIEYFTHEHRLKPTFVNMKKYIENASKNVNVMELFPIK